jgi:hypothetical protein
MLQVQPDPYIRDREFTLYVDLEAVAERQSWAVDDIFGLVAPNMSYAFGTRVEPFSADPRTALPFSAAGILGNDAVLATVTAAPHPVTGSSLLSQDDFYRWCYRRPRTTGPVTSPGPSDVFEIPRRFMFDRLASLVEGKQLLEKLRFLLNVIGQGSLHGVAFEGTALSALAATQVNVTLTFIRGANTNTTINSRSAVIGPAPGTGIFQYFDGQTLPAPSLHHNLRPTSCDPEVGIPEGAGLYRLPSGFPGLDGVIIATDTQNRWYAALLQVTVARRHDVADSGVQAIVKALKKHRRNYEQILLFVVDDAKKGKGLAKRAYAATPSRHWSRGYIVLTLEGILDKLSQLR